MWGGTVGSSLTTHEAFHELGTVAGLQDWVKEQRLRASERSFLTFTLTADEEGSTDGCG
jgi:hypothetical protein